MGSQDEGSLETYEFYWDLQPSFFCECPDGVQRYPDERLERGHVSIDGNSRVYGLPSGYVAVRAHDFDEAEDKLKRLLDGVGFDLDRLDGAGEFYIERLLEKSRGQGDGGKRHGW